jgi:hypothetical protein
MISPFWSLFRFPIKSLCMAVAGGGGGGGGGARALPWQRTICKEMRRSTFRERLVVMVSSTLPFSLCLVGLGFLNSACKKIEFDINGSEMN